MLSSGPDGRPTSKVSTMPVFEFDGAKYRQASKHQQEWGARLIDGLALAGNEQILDLGCGDGTLTSWLASLVPNGHVTGIDASVSMIDTAKHLATDNLGFVLMDIVDMDFTDRFDLIFSNAALHWVNDHQELLRRSRAALRERGMIRWNFAGDGNCSNFFATVRTVMAQPEFRRCFDGFEWPWFMPDPSTYQTMVKGAGFSDVNVTGENADRSFADVDEMIRWIDQPSLVPFLPHLPDNERGVFRETVIDQMVERTRQSDGRCFETFRRINVAAVK